MELFFISLAALLSVINPLATVPVFASLTSDKTALQVRITAFKAALNMLIILLISFFAGEYILKFFGISLPSLQIAGGLIITTSGFALLTGSFNKHKGMRKEVKDDAFARQEISLTPIAIPMLAGPGTISLLVAYRQLYHGINEVIMLSLSMLMVAVATFIVLWVSRPIVNKMGVSGINALSRIIGFIVIAIGVEFVLSALAPIFG